MLILALDTSTNRLSLALCRDEALLARREGVPAQRPGEALLGEIDLLLRAADLRPGDLQGIAVGLGPGTFTGLRVGLAAAQGLSQSLGIPLAGVSSFLAVAAANHQNDDSRAGGRKPPAGREPGAGRDNARGTRDSLGSSAGAGDATLVVSDARQGLWYTGLYAPREGVWRELRPESLQDPDAAVRELPAGLVTLSGPGAGEFAAAVRPGSFILAPEVLRWPQASVIAGLAAPALAAGGMPPEALAPHYLRRTQAEETRDRREGNPA